MDSDIEEKRQNAIDQVWIILLNHILLDREVNILMIYRLILLICKFVFLPIKFFTKGAIVPSPWAAPDTRRAPQMYMNSKFMFLFCYF